MKKSTNVIPEWIKPKRGKALTTPVSSRLPSSVVEKLKEEAKSRGWNMSSIIAEAVYLGRPDMEWPK